MFTLQVPEWSRLLASLRGGCVLSSITDDIDIVPDNISRNYLLK